jgi:hypothetical protein
VAGCPWNGWPDVHGIGGWIIVVRAIQKAKEAGRLVLHTDGSIDAAASDARPGGVDRFRPADEVMHLSAASVNLQVPA